MDKSDKKRRSIRSAIKKASRETELVEFIRLAPFANLVEEAHQRLKMSILRDELDEAEAYFDF